MSDNKLFWKTVRPFFSNNGSHRGNIKLVEGVKLLQDDSEVVEQLNNFFKEAVSTLDVNEDSYIINPENGVHISDPIEKAITKFKFHPSILLINDNIVNQDKFSFKPISKLDIDKEVHIINPKKASTSERISPEILNINSEVSTDTLRNLFNDMLKTGNFSDNLKLADITPVFKKKNPLHKVNYRPVGVLSSISKVSEKLMRKKIRGYISNYLSPYLCGYRKGFSLQQALMSLVKNW